MDEYTLVPRTTQFFCGEKLVPAAKPAHVLVLFGPISQFEQGGRQDLADKEKQELVLLQAYMPQALSDAEIEAAVSAAIGDAAAKGMADMGKVMAVLMPKVRGRADGKQTLTLRWLWKVV